MVVDLYDRPALRFTLPYTKPDMIEKTRGVIAPLLQSFVNAWPITRSRVRTYIPRIANRDEQAIDNGLASLVDRPSPQLNEGLMNDP